MSKDCMYLKTRISIIDFDAHRDIDALSIMGAHEGSHNHIKSSKVGIPSV